MLILKTNLIEVNPLIYNSVEHNRLGKWTVAQPVNNFPDIYKTECFNAMHLAATLPHIPL
jgi:hypothetical protein